MPDRLRRPRPRSAVPFRRPRLVLLSLLVMLAVGGVSVVPAAAATPYSIDRYFAAGYERQIDNRTCTAASTAMMMNFIARRDLKLNQMAILRYEQPRDALNDGIQRGSDPLGWSRAATYYSRFTGKPTTYKWEAYGTARLALRRAAEQIALTSKPVGLLVRNGTHAMVMTGFTSTLKPAAGVTWELSTIKYSDPLDPDRLTRRTATATGTATGTPLNKYTQTDATTYYDTQWVNKYIVIVPQS